MFTSHRSGRQRRHTGLVRTGITVLVAMSALALSGVAAGSTNGVVLSKSGPAGEGPYPYKYPASGTTQVGSGTTILGTKCTAGTPQVPSPYADPCIAHLHGQQRRRDLDRGDLHHHHARRAPVPDHCQRQQMAGRRHGGRRRAAVRSGPGPAGLLELLQQGLRPLRPQGRPPAHDRDRQQHDRGAQRGPDPGVCRRHDDRPRCMRSARPAAVPTTSSRGSGRSRSAPRTTSWWSSTATLLRRERLQSREPLRLVDDPGLHQGRRSRWPR
jgi:hypothetical protein